MAILVDNEYQKIINSSYDYTGKNMFVTLGCYRDKVDRENEKKLASACSEIKGKINNYIEVKGNELLSEINNVQALDTITDRDVFLSQYPILKFKVEQFENMRQEAMQISDKLLKQGINFDLLVFKDEWVSLGLTRELCIPINYSGEITFMLEDVKTLELPSLYYEVKKKYSGTVEDC